jgi:hypothetical protein
MYKVLSENLQMNFVDVGFLCAMLTIERLWSFQR